MTIFPIPWEEALQGCRLSIENAERLAEDALLLNHSGRTQSAYAVSLDAWEELGKAIILYRYYTTKESISSIDWFDILRDHKHKRVAWVNSTDILYGSRPPNSVAALKTDLEKSITEDNFQKWLTLERDVGAYVDWVGGKDGWRSLCHLQEPWFNSPPPMPPVFDAMYWASNTRLICHQLRDKVRDGVETTQQRLADSR